MCDGSVRLRLILYTTLTALSHVHRAVDLMDITKNVDAVRFVTALGKSHAEKEQQTIR